MADKTPISDTSLWRSIFGWETLLRWDVWGAVVPGVFFAGGVGMLGLDWFPQNLLFSQLCFIAVAVLVLAKTIGHVRKYRTTMTKKTLVCAVISIPTIALIGFAIWAIQSHKNSNVEAQAKVNPDCPPGTAFCLSGNGTVILNGLKAYGYPAGVYAVGNKSLTAEHVYLDSRTISSYAMSTKGIEEFITTIIARQQESWKNLPEAIRSQLADKQTELKQNIETNKEDPIEAAHSMVELAILKPSIPSGATNLQRPK